jgi:hypothetical protein
MGKCPDASTCACPCPPEDLHKWRNSTRLPARRPGRRELGDPQGEVFIEIGVAVAAAITIAIGRILQIEPVPHLPFVRRSVRVGVPTGGAMGLRVVVPPFKVFLGIGRARQSGLAAL